MVRWFRCLVVTSLFAPALLLGTSDAAACSCVTFGDVVSPRPEARHVASLPLVHYSSFTPPPALFDEEGSPLELETIRELPQLGLCSGTFRFLVPAPPFESNAEYTAVLGASYRGPSEVRFETGSSTVEKKSVKLVLTATLIDHDDYVSSQSGCADPKLDDRTIPSSLSVSLEASAPVLLFLDVRVEHPIVGTLVDSGMTTIEIDDSVSPAYAGVPLPEGALACAEVGVTDASGSDVFRRMFCPNAGAPETANLEAKVVVVSRPERPHQPAIEAGCSVRPSRVASPRPGALLLAALVGAASLRRRRRATSG